MLYYMKINLDDRLVQELDSIFDNERISQVEWDVCIEDIVEEHIARHNGTWEEHFQVPETWEELHAKEEEVTTEELDEIYIDLRNGTGKNGEYKPSTNQPPPRNQSKNLRNRMR